MRVILATLLVASVACSTGSSQATPQPIVIYEPSPTLTALCEEAVETANTQLRLMRRGANLGANLSAIQDLLDSCMMIGR